MDFKLIISLLLIIFGLIPLICLLTIKNNKDIKVVFSVLFALYCVIICVGVFTNIHISKIITIKTFKFEKLQKSFNWSIITKNRKDIFLNLSMLIPFGFLLGVIFNKNVILKTVFIGLISSVIIEVVQLIIPIPRFAQLSDIVLNVISCLIGAVLCFFVKLFRNKNSKIN